MPGGKVHTAVTVVLAAAVPGVLLYNQFPVRQAVLIGAGCFSGVILTPDLDVDAGSISQRNVRRWGGPLAGKIWNAFWKPYAVLVKHRSIVSHAPVVGTFIRLVYLIGIPWLVWLALSQFVDWIPAPHRLIDLPTSIGWFFLGLVISDTAHFLCDNIFHR